MIVDNRVRAPAVSPGSAVAPTAPAASPAAPDAFTAQRHQALPEVFASAVPSNNFQATLTGPNPPKTGGGFFTQLGQANELRKLAGMASEHLDSGGQSPSNTVVEAKLRSLDRLPIAPNEQVTRAVYSSAIPNASPRDYQFSSLASKLGSGIVGGGEKQHETWKAVHAHLFSSAQAEAVQWTR